MNNKKQATCFGRLMVNLLPVGAAALLSISQVWASDDKQVDAQKDQAQTEASSERSQPPANEVMAVGEPVDVGALKGVAIINIMGQEVGRIEQVVANNQTGEVGLVLSAQDGQELLAPVEELFVVGNSLVWDTPMTRQELADAEVYEPEAYSEVSEFYSQPVGEPVVGMTP